MSNSLQKNDMIKDAEMTPFRLQTETINDIGSPNKLYSRQMLHIVCVKVEVQAEKFP
jgi:hypothetical protein